MLFPAWLSPARSAVARLTISRPPQRCIRRRDCLSSHRRAVAGDHGDAVSGVLADAWKEWLGPIGVIGVVGQGGRIHGEVGDFERRLERDNSRAEVLLRRIFRRVDQHPPDSVYLPYSACSMTLPEAFFLHGSESNGIGVIRIWRRSRLSSSTPALTMLRPRGGEEILLMNYEPGFRVVYP